MTTKATAAVRGKRVTKKPGRAVQHRSRASAEEEVLTTAHDLAVALHRVGAMDAVTMREIDTLCLPPRANYGSAEVRRIRAATRMSQPVFARLLGVDKSAVAQWERGVRRPSGPAARLLEVLDPERDESLVVRVRQGMVSAA